MTYVQFCFWLQGYFEISEKVRKKLSERQLKIILNHLELVRITNHPDQAKYPKCQEFCSWLGHYLQICGTRSTAAAISSQLSKIFEHEVDKMFPPADQAGMNAAHSGVSIAASYQGFNPNSTVIRC